MLTTIKNYFLKKIYKCLIFRTIVIDKANVRHYEALKEFCRVDMNTDKGTFTFIFKEDRRVNSRIVKFPHITNYIIELTVPEGLSEVTSTLRKKIVIVVKVMLHHVNYTLLTEVLADMYLDVILNYRSETQTL